MGTEGKYWDSQAEIGQKIRNATSTYYRSVGLEPASIHQHLNTLASNLVGIFLGNRIEQVRDRPDLEEFETNALLARQLIGDEIRRIQNLSDEDRQTLAYLVSGEVDAFRSRAFEQARNGVPNEFQLRSARTDAARASFARSAYMELQFTEQEREALANAEKVIDASFRAREQLRGLLEPIGYQAVGKSRRGPDMADDFTTLVQDIGKYGLTILNTIAAAAVRRGDPDRISECLADCVRDLKGRVLAKFKSSDTQRFDLRKFESQLRARANEVVVTMRSIAPAPWLTTNETQEPSSMTSNDEKATVSAENPVLASPDWPKPDKNLLPGGVKRAGVSDSRRKAAASAEFWKARQAEFEKYATQYPRFVANWDALSCIWWWQYGETAEGILRVPEECIAVFKAVARNAATGLPDRATYIPPESGPRAAEDAEPCQKWLDFMRFRGWNFRETSSPTACTEREWDAGVKDGKPLGIIRGEQKYSTGDEWKDVCERMPDGSLRQLSSEELKGKSSDELRHYYHWLVNGTIAPVFQASARFCEELSSHALAAEADLKASISVPGTVVAGQSKPRLPLDVLVPIGEIENKVRRLIEDCDSGLISPFSLLEQDIPKMTDFMRAGAIEAFQKRAEYYVSRPDFCQSWLGEAADETIFAILNLVPVRFNGSAFKRATPLIVKDLRKVLDSVIPPFCEPREPGKPEQSQMTLTRETASPKSLPAPENDSGAVFNSQETIYWSPAHFQHQYGEDFPAYAQRQIELLRQKANQRFQTTPINSFDDLSKAKKTWLLELATGAAAVMGAVGAKQTWSADQTRRMLKDFAIKAAYAAQLTAPAAERFFQSDEWKRLDDALFPSPDNEAEHIHQIVEERPAPLPEAATGNSTVERPGTRVPDIETSRARLALLNRLRRELAAVKQTVKRYCTPAQLKSKHPDFDIWKHLEDSEVRDLANGVDFQPGTYAKSLVLRVYGITSVETLRKDRRKVRAADRKSDNRPPSA